MKIPIHTIDEYRSISADVWNVFRKYFDESMNTDEFTTDIHEIHERYKFNPRLYEFEQKLLKLYMTELQELKMQRAKLEEKQ